MQISFITEFTRVVIAWCSKRSRAREPSAVCRARAKILVARKLGREKKGKRGGGGEGEGAGLPLGPRTIKKENSFFSNPGKEQF